jgi:hypothetical protein
MKCLLCETEMKCENDVNDISTRIDWLSCTKCGSVAEVQYGNNGELSKVIWEKDRK